MTQEDEGMAGNDEKLAGAIASAQDILTYLRDFPTVQDMRDAELTVYIIAGCDCHYRSPDSPYHIHVFTPRERSERPEISMTWRIVAKYPV